MGFLKRKNNRNGLSELEKQELVARASVGIKERDEELKFSSEFFLTNRRFERTLKKSDDCPRVKKVDLKLKKEEPLLEDKYKSLSENYEPDKFAPGSKEGNYINKFNKENYGDLSGLMKMFSSEQGDEMMAEIALLRNYFFPQKQRKQIASFINHFYNLPSYPNGTPIYTSVIKQAEENYLIDLEGEQGVEAGEAFRKRLCLVTRKKDKDIVSKLEKRLNDVGYKRTARELTTFEKVMISCQNKKSGISAEELAKTYNLKSKNTVYTINKSMKDYNLFEENVVNLDDYRQPDKVLGEKVFSISDEDVSSLI